MELRGYQDKGLYDVKYSIARKGNRRVILQAPTGAGKTVFAMAVVNGALAKNKRVCFAVPALSLIDQTVEMFWANGITDVGVIQGSHEHTRRSAPVQVASVQTLMRRDLPDVDVVIIDEVHRWFEFYAEWLAKPEWQDIPFIGLSATPWTKGLGKYWDDLVIATTTKELIELGYLAPYRAFAAAHPDLQGVRTVAGDYHEGQLAEAMERGALVADIVRTWRSKADGVPTFVFGVNRAHAQHIRDCFDENGVATAYIDGNTEVEDRLRIRDRFHAGDVEVVCSVGCLTTGIDWDVRCIVLARPTKSEILYVQMIGRGLRTAPGKDHLLILDHSDTTARLGFVDDIHHEHLDMGKPRQKADREREDPLPKECPNCHFLKPPKVAECPLCQHRPERQNDVEHVEGELKELIKGRKKNFNDKEKWEIFAQLKHIQQSRGYKPGWVQAKFKDLTGSWARKYADAVPVPPSPELLSWITSTNIAYAKSNKRRAA